MDRHFGEVMRRDAATHFAAWLLRQSKVRKQIIISLTDLSLLTGAMVVALLVVALPSMGTWPAATYWVLAGGVLLAVVLLHVLGVHHIVSRHADVDLIERSFGALFIASIVLLGVLSLRLPLVLALAIPFLFGAMGFAAVLMSRAIAVRLLKPASARKRGARVLIYGAGEGGVQLAAALRNGDRFCPVVFVDSNPSLHGRRIHGLKVFPTTALEKLHNEGVFEQVLLAVPSATPQQRLHILEQLEALSVKVLVMPALEDIAAGISRVDQLREVQVEDLLPRSAVKPDKSLLCRSLNGKTVLVTGAGGSIGSELCRQAMLHGASRLILVECSEYSLYRIDHELRQSPLQGQCDVVPLLINAVNGQQITRAFQEYPVQVVYHAAAYKHVPLVEANPCAAVLNNVQATQSVVTAAIAAGVERFVLVSTDKAVRPPNVMGASKRFCELVVQAAAVNAGRTALSMVRFGNVLGSSGSVVPLFKEQIRRGGPVTVTHPEVTRYFMTIPEAAQLVIQAGAMGDQGEVFLLQMGQPVKIRDLAERMIHLSGRTLVDPASGQGDVEIRYTGLRPGEKLYEELLIGAEAQATSHPRIYKAAEEWFTPEVLESHLSALLAAAHGGDVRALKCTLSQCVAGYVYGAPAELHDGTFPDEEPRQLTKKTKAQVPQPTSRPTPSTPADDRHRPTSPAHHTPPDLRPAFGPVGAEAAGVHRQMATTSATSDISITAAAAAAAQHPLNR